jgi:hypothetical protein
MNETPKNPREIIFSSDDCVVVVFEGPGDKTRRPRRKNIPRDWPPGGPPQEPQPPTDQPPPPADGNGQ